MKKVLLLSCFVLGGATLASASYELALIYDVTNRQILRYDPVSNRALGSFGAGNLGYYGNANVLALDPSAKGSVLALDITGVLRRFDYSTGIRLGALQLATGGTNQFGRSIKVLSNGNYLVTSDVDASSKVFDRNTGALLTTFQSFSGYTSLDCVQLSDGSFASLERTAIGSNFDFHLFRRDTSGTFSSWTPNIMTGVPNGTLSTLNTEANLVTALGINVFPRFRQFSFTAAGYTAIAQSSHLWGGNSVTSLVSGHAGQGYFIQNINAAAGKLYVMDNVSRHVADIAVTPYTQTMGSMVMVVAPEPASLTALALGSVVLLRRRRRAKL